MLLSIAYCLDVLKGTEYGNRDYSPDAKCLDALLGSYFYEN